MERNAEDATRSVVRVAHSALLGAQGAIGRVVFVGRIRGGCPVKYRSIRRKAAWFRRSSSAILLVWSVLGSFRVEAQGNTGIDASRYVYVSPIVRVQGARDSPIIALATFRNGHESYATCGMIDAGTSPAEIRREVGSHVAGLEVLLEIYRVRDSHRFLQEVSVACERCANDRAGGCGSLARGRWLRRYTRDRAFVSVMAQDAGRWRNPTDSHGQLIHTLQVSVELTPSDPRAAVTEVRDALGAIAERDRWFERIGVVERVLGARDGYVERLRWIGRMAQQLGQRRGDPRTVSGVHVAQLEAERNRVWLLTQEAAPAHLFSPLLRSQREELVSRACVFLSASMAALSAFGRRVADVSTQACGPAGVGVSDDATLDSLLDAGVPTAYPELIGRPGIEAAGSMIPSRMAPTYERKWQYSEVRPRTRGDWERIIRTLTIADLFETSVRLEPYSDGVMVGVYVDLTRPLAGHGPCDRVRGHQRWDSLADAVCGEYAVGLWVGVKAQAPSLPDMRGDVVIEQAVVVRELHSGVVRYVATDASASDDSTVVVAHPSARNALQQLTGDIFMLVTRTGPIVLTN